MSSEASEDHRTIIASDSESDDGDASYYFANGYYEHNKNDSADHALEEAEDNHDDDEEVTLDFDSGTSVVTGSLAFGSGSFYLERTSGTYSQDDFTFLWGTNSISFDGGPGTGSLGTPVFDAGNSDNHHASEQADNNAFGLNYSSGYDWPISSSTALLYNDDGYNFELEDLDVKLVENETSAANSFVAIERSDATGDHYWYASTSDTESWDYEYGAWNYDTWNYDIITDSFESLDDLLDTDVFEDVSSLNFYVRGDMVMDNIEIELSDVV